VLDASWQPTASLDTLKQAAHLRQLIRQFMDTAGVLEVSTPVLSHAATTDPALHSFELRAQGQTCYLHTSPEFAMKRLLAAHQHDIYQLVPVFRDAEHGHKHNPEFTMLEWYRIGFDHHQLMDSMEALLQDICTAFSKPWHQPQRKPYRELVEAELDSAMHTVSLDRIRQHFRQHERSFPHSDIGLDAALDLLMDTFVLPRFDSDRFTFITDYPASQAALARLAMDEKGNAVASRFELYFGSLEVGNGYHELTDAQELQQRISRDTQTRVEQSLPSVTVDQHFIAAHSAGLPDCAGVAVGFERLLMSMSEVDGIDQAVAFAFDRA